MSVDKNEIIDQIVNVNMNMNVEGEGEGMRRELIENLKQLNL
jgi:hypothetical protein